jgi:molybdopterin converting factor small subunit
MRITVKYMAQLKQAATVPSEALDVDGPCTAEEVLRRLAERHDERFRRIVLDGNGKVHAALLLFVGDEQVPPGSPHVFRDGDVLTVLAPMSGG